MPDNVFPEILTLVQRHMHLHFERIEQRCSETARGKAEEFAATGNLRSGYHLKTIGDLRAQCIREWAQELWAILAEALVATDAAYTPELEKQLVKLIDESLPAPPEREYHCYEQLAERVGFDPQTVAEVGAGVRYQLAEASDHARRDVKGKLALEMTRRKRRGRSEPRGAVTVNLNIDGSTIGVLNTGNIEQLSAVVTNLRQNGEDELANAVAQLGESIATASSVSAATRDDLLELLASMAAEGAKPKTGRPRASLRALFDGFTARVKDVQALHQAWLAVEPVFRLLLG